LAPQLAWRSRSPAVEHSARLAPPALARLPSLAIDGQVRITTVEQMVREGLSSRWFDAVVIGVLAAMPPVRFVSAMLFGVQPPDPAVFATVAIGVAAVAILATFVPARRASRVDPMVALRTD
jgi:hypothetical protein